MSPKEKAIELVNKFRIHSPVWEVKDDAKKCALISVDECIESTKQLVHHYTKGDNNKYADIYLSMSLSVEYWQEVKKYIRYDT